MASSSRKVDLLKYLKREQNVSDSAGRCLISHGQLTIDGHVVKPTDNLRWTRRQLEGRMMEFVGRQHRMFGASRRLEFAE